MSKQIVWVGLVVLGFVMVSGAPARADNDRHDRRGLQRLEIDGVASGEPSTWLVRGDVFGRGTATATLPGGAFFAVTANGRGCGLFDSNAPGTPLVITARNGSTLSLNLIGLVCNTGVADIAYQYTGSYLVTGGTGRFANVTGGVGTFTMAVTGTSGVLEGIHLHGNLVR